MEIKPTSEKKVFNFNAVAAMQGGRVILSCRHELDLNTIIVHTSGPSFELPKLRLVSEATREEAERQEALAGMDVPEDARHFYWCEACD